MAGPYLIQDSTRTRIMAKKSQDNVVRYKNGGGAAKRRKTKRTGRVGRAVKKVYGG